MLNPNFIILYVKDPIQSGSFYAKLLGNEPIEGSPAFVRIALSSDMMLGLWSKEKVIPQPTGDGNASELNFIVKSQAELKSLFQDWTEKGLEIIQDVTELYFGQTFVAVDPDSHRLRVLFPKDNPQS